MRSSGAVLDLGIFLGLSTLSAGLAWTACRGNGEPMRWDEYITLAFGGLSAILLGVGLMALKFHSRSHRFDEPPRFY